MKKKTKGWGEASRNFTQYAQQISGNFQICQQSKIWEKRMREIGKPVMITDLMN